MRVCLVYDCLYPWTVGGAERWYRSLAERLAAAGHEVTYLTRLQWEPGQPPQIEGVRVIAVSPDEPLYGPDGARRIGEALRFGRGVLRHLARNRGRYDVVHTCSFPYFSVLAARAATAGTVTRLLVDWFEVWTREYWFTYTGRARGLAGWLVQGACVRIGHQPLVFSRLHRRRLAAHRLARPPILLPGLYSGCEPVPRRSTAAQPPTVLFAGRHIAEKQVTAVVPAVARARTRLASLRAEILGDGPERPLVLAGISELGADSYVSAPGFVDEAAVKDAISSGLCLLLPSRREGYGLVVIEAAAAGTPSIVVDGPDNAAVELVEDGVNGVVAASTDPDDLAAAILAVHEAGGDLRERTAAWFDDNRERLSAEASLKVVLEHYAGYAASVRR